MRNRYIELFVLILLFFNGNLYSQLKEAIKNDHSYILTKFPYSKTLKFEKLYCKMYPDVFECENLKSSEKGMFSEKFNLADRFFVKLWLRPVGQQNYDALNIAGLYLREKRPKVGDSQYEYTFLDIELDTLTRWIYAHNSDLTSSHAEEVDFKIAYLDLLKENLFLIDIDTYFNELSASNNFKGDYYSASRRFVTNMLFNMLRWEKNPIVRKEIEKVIATIPDEFTAPFNKYK